MGRRTDQQLECSAAQRTNNGSDGKTYGPTTGVMGRRQRTNNGSDGKTNGPTTGVFGRLNGPTTGVMGRRTDQQRE